jgi:hypothetical protein
MKPDRYTKSVLTVIALMLTVIACKSVVSPEKTAQAQGQYAGIQYAGHGEFFDTHTGGLWAYTFAHDEFSKTDSSKIIRVPPKWEYYGIVTELGHPLVDAPK